MANSGIQLLGFGLSLVGVIALIVGTILPQWKMSAYIGDNIITAVAMYQGLWMRSPGHPCPDDRWHHCIHRWAGLVACSWFAHNVIRAFYNPYTPVNTKFEFGAAIFIAWGGSFLDVLGGAMLASSCPRSKKPVPKYPAMSGVSARSPPSSTKEYV
ncbi:unnamed protein product [Coregonus sp. 'balchen']|nr:unnamed protein product [Coregonus sp. 'balchen']